MKKVVLICLLFIGNLLSAQVQFEAKVSRNTVGLNERFRIDFSMNADGDDFTPPNFEACGFRLIAGPSQMVSQSWVNGRSSFQKAYSYTLMPLQKGNLTIKSATIEINGQVYKSNPVKISVSNSVELPKDPNQIPQINVDDNLYLVADISKTNPFVNEPITVVYKLYFSNNIGISDFKELNKPKYNDFWSQNIDIKEFVPGEENFKGQRFRYVVLRKTVLYPQKSGKLDIEPLSLEIECQVPTGRRNIFGQFQVTEASKRVSAGSKSINVKALPEEGKPEDFAGAVGKFNFNVSPSATTLKSGESLTLKVSVTGTGNLKLFSLPKPIVPSSLEMYDPEHKENINTPLSGMNGSVIDNYTIIPQYKGNYAIKPLKFSYFDLGTSSYKTITSSEINLNVLQGEGIASKNPTLNPNKVPVEAAKSFAYIKQKTNLSQTDEKGFLGSGLFYSLLFLPLLAIPFVVVIKKKKDEQDADVFGNKIKMSNKLAKKYLSEAKQHLNNKEPFYIALEKSMHNFLKAKINIETSEMNKDKISEIMLARNANPETISEFITLTENCELARYAQSSSVAIQQDYDKAVEIISELEKQIA
jgi:hypothetical protein